MVPGICSPFFLLSHLCVSVPPCANYHILYNPLSSCKDELCNHARHMKQRSQQSSNPNLKRTRTTRTKKKAQWIRTMLLRIIRHSVKILGREVTSIRDRVQIRDKRRLHSPDVGPIHSMEEWMRHNLVHAVSAQSHLG